MAAEGIDPDLTGAAGDRRPHQTPRLIALVIIGGAIGAPLRYLLSRAVPTAHDSWPTATFITNIGGALLLGFLLESLLRAGPDSGARRGLRILLGTGVLGAFTTYSTLVTETDLLIRDGCYGLAAGYCLASVVVGILAAVAGIGLARVIPAPGSDA